MPFLDCLISLVLWTLVAVILVYIVEALIGLLVTLPPQVFVLMRLLAALLVVLALLSCLGLWAGFGMPHGRGLR